VDHAVKVWIERGLKPATIQTNLSMVRVFATWLGKPASMVKAATHYVQDPALVKRTYTATEDKSWTAAGVSLDLIRERACAIDQRAAAALMLMRAFGLRVKEAYMLRPNVAVIEGRMMVIKSDAWTLEDYLAVVRGTKGGRKRMVPVDTDEKRAALEFAKALTRSTQESVGGPTRSLAQVKRRHYYVMDLLGVTKAALGITSHGLRHEYASERYETFADAPSPIRGGAGKKVPGDDRARIQVAQELGHARRSITNAYYGSSANPPQSVGYVDAARSAKV
jgi:integrase